MTVPPSPPVVIPREAFLALQVALLTFELWQTKSTALSQQVQAAMVAAGLDPAGKYALDPTTCAATRQEPL